jgi:hypothetical protein
MHSSFHCARYLSCHLKVHERLKYLEFPALKDSAGFSSTVAPLHQTARHHTDNVNLNDNVLGLHSGAVWLESWPEQ